MSTDEVGQELDLTVIEEVNDGALAGVTGLPGEDGDDQLDFLSRCQVVTDYDGRDHTIDPMTHCLDCHALIRCKVPQRRPRWYRIHYKNLVSGIHKGHCQCTGDRKSRTFVWKENGALPMWIPSKTYRSTAAKRKRRRDQREDSTTQENQDRMLTDRSNDQSNTNEPVIPDLIIPEASIDNADDDATRQAVYAIIEEDEPETIIERFISRTSTSAFQFFQVMASERLGQFTRKVWYKCPRCSRDVWSWKLVEGITCMSCMGFTDVQVWGERSSNRIATEATDATALPEMIELIMNFFMEYGFAGSIRFILSYALQFLRFCMQWPRHGNSSGTDAYESRHPDGIDLNEPLL